MWEVRMSASEKTYTLEIIQWWTTSMSKNTVIENAGTNNRKEIWRKYSTLLLVRLESILDMMIYVHITILYVPKATIKFIKLLAIQKAG